MQSISNFDEDRTATAFSQAGQPTARTRILIVDDETTIAWLLKEGLAEFADEVISADSGEQALQLFATTPFDVLITDYKMPHMDGLALAGRVKQLQPRVRMVLLTAYGSEWLNQCASEVGIRHVLNKPVRLAEIRSLVSMLLHV